VNESKRGNSRLLARLSAELVVIVLGVLIALWADGWVAERADRRVEASRIAVLRQALARMDSTFERLALLQADMVMVRQLNIDPYVIREFDLGPIVGPWVGIDDLTGESAPPDVDIRVSRNLSLFKLDLVEQEIRTYRETMEALDEVENAIDAYT
jgi:hypothetical protein